jgi:transposase InsO family protein
MTHAMGCLSNDAGPAPVCAFRSKALNQRESAAAALRRDGAAQGVVVRHHLHQDRRRLAVSGLPARYSCRIVGWGTSKRIDSELIIWALSMAAWRFKPDRTICHSDRGVQYASQAYQDVLK